MKFPSNRPFKLLYLINGLGPGGAERSFAGLLPFYIKANIKPLVVCLDSTTNGVEEHIREYGCKVLILHSHQILGQCRELRRVIRSGHFDLVHTTLFDADVIGRLAAAGSGVPVLTSLVSTSYDRARLADPNVGQLGLWATRVVDGWTARHLTTWFHAITKAVKKSAVRHLGIPGERVTVIERGRSREVLGKPTVERRRTARRRLGFDDDEEIAVNVARQDYAKGQKYLLEATRILLKSRPRLSVLICGRKGHATAQLQAMCADFGLEGKVQFLGDRPDVPDILAAADVFVFPSIYEGLGGAVIEAMAMGLPIVLSDIPALREVVEGGENAVLVPPRDGDAFAAALSKVLDDPELARAYGRRSQDIFQKRFTIERSANRMIELYARVAGLAIQ